MKNSNKFFYLGFSKNFFRKGDTISIFPSSSHIKIVDDYHKKWYKLILQYITFELYKAPFEYKCEVVPNDN